MGKKVLAAIVGSLILAVLAFMGYVLKNYGDFNSIPHWDLTMWIFWAVLGILILLGMLAVILLYALSLQDQEEPVEDGSYIEINNDEIQEARPTEEPVEIPVEEQTEEEAPAELQVEAPELSEMVTEETVEAAVEAPEEWAEREYE